MNERDLLFQISNTRMMMTLEAGMSYLAGIAAYYKAIEAGHADLLSKIQKEAFQPTVFSFSQGADNIIKNIDTAPNGSIVVIPIKGAFLKYGTMCAYGADEITPAMYKAAISPNIDAVVMDFDSGGGAENAVPPFLEAIRFIQKNRKPVLAHGDMVASAAYYVASHCDYITSDNKISSSFGSIGCLIPWTDVRKQLELQGIAQRYFYAPQSTKKNFETRELLDNNNEQPLLENVLRPAVDRFVANVKRARKGRINFENEDIWAGDMFEGDAIIKNGLADQFATLRETIEIAASFKK